MKIFLSVMIAVLAAGAIPSSSLSALDSPKSSDVIFEQDIQLTPEEYKKKQDENATDFAVPIIASIGGIVLLISLIYLYRKRFFKQKKSSRK